MKPISVPILVPALVGSLVVLALPSGASATAPSGCVEHTPFDDSADAPGDYRCAGIAIAFHHDGPDHSPHPLWAGQWLFTDEQGNFRRGSCTYNLGMHPTIEQPSAPWNQHLPYDPGGVFSSYLLWRYGDTDDPLTAAAMWAVMHYYAQDDGGSNRSDNPTAALIPALESIAAATGRQDLQDRAVALHAEAARYGGPWTLAVTLDATGVVTISLAAGPHPLPGEPVSLVVSGSDVPLTATTGDDGLATVTVPLPPSGTVTVAAVAEAPGPAVVYRGTPVVRAPHGAQTLIAAGEPTQVTATAQLQVQAVADPPPVTEPPATDPPVTDPATTAPATTAPQVAVSGHDDMPATGAGGDGEVAYLATASLVGGVGLLGTLRRRGAARIESAG